MVFPIFILSFALVFLTEFQRIALAEPYIKLDSLTECPATGVPIELEYSLFEIRENDYALNSRFVFPEDLTDKFQYNVVIHKWANGVWQENVHQKDGFVCEDGHAYISKLWDRMVQDGNPAFQADCPIPAGEYKMTDFELNRDDIQLPGTMDGRIKLVTQLFDENEIQILCLEFEGRIQN